MVQYSALGILDNMNATDATQTKQPVKIKIYDRISEEKHIDEHHAPCQYMTLMPMQRSDKLTKQLVSSHQNISTIDDWRASREVNYAFHTAASSGWAGWGAFVFWKERNAAAFASFC